MVALGSVLLNDAAIPMNLHLTSGADSFGIVKNVVAFLYQSVWDWLQWLYGTKEHE